MKTYLLNKMVLGFLNKNHKCFYLFHLFTFSNCYYKINLSRLMIKIYNKNIKIAEINLAEKNKTSEIDYLERLRKILYH